MLYWLKLKLLQTASSALLNYVRSGILPHSRRAQCRVGVHVFLLREAHDTYGITASREAIRAIRDWAVNGPVARPTPRSANDFGRLVFNDAVQRIKLPQDVYKALVAPSTAANALTSRWPTPSRWP